MFTRCASELRVCKGLLRAGWVGRPAVKSCFRLCQGKFLRCMGVWECVAFGFRRKNSVGGDVLPMSGRGKAN